MRINDQAQHILATQGTKGPKALRGVDAARGAGGSDSVSVSSSGQVIQKALGAMAALPEIRSDLVAELKAKIESGQYQVSGREVAGSILAGLRDDEG